MDSKSLNMCDISHNDIKKATANHIDNIQKNSPDINKLKTDSIKFNNNKSINEEDLSKKKKKNRRKKKKNVKSEKEDNDKTTISELNTKSETKMINDISDCQFDSNNQIEKKLENN